MAHLPSMAPNSNEMNYKKNREGQTRRNIQGLTMLIVRYVNNKDITIRFVETGELRKTTYHNFNKGTVWANLLEHPVGNECTFQQAKVITVGLVILAIGAIAAAILSITI